jgi:hypothetical protein
MLFSCYAPAFSQLLHSSWQLARQQSQNSFVLIPASAFLVSAFTKVECASQIAIHLPPASHKPSSRAFAMYAFMCFVSFASLKALCLPLCMTLPQLGFDVRHLRVFFYLFFPNICSN